LQQAFVF